MRILKVRIASYADMKARTMAIARGQLKPRPGDPKVWFPSAESLVKVLSDKNRMLLGIIREAEPKIASGVEAAAVIVEPVRQLMADDDANRSQVLRVVGCQTE